MTRFAFTTAAAPALATGIYLVVDSLVVGFELTAFQYEKVGALDTYFDGDTAGAAWDGADGNSTSTLGAVVVVHPHPSVRAVANLAVPTARCLAVPSARYVDEQRAVARLEA